MYIIKNAYLSLVRGKGRNILIGIIITAIIVSACIALSIKDSSDALIQSYINSNLLEISFTLDTMSYRDATDEEKAEYESLTIEKVIEYGDSDYVTDYYYTMETTVSGTDLTAISYDLDSDSSDNSSDDKFGGQSGSFGSIGDFRLSAYSNAAYINDFVDGVKKIIDGSMIESDNTDAVIVISEELALENDLKVGDEVELYLPSDETVAYTFTILGIYSDDSEVESNNFISMNATNSRNQIYTNFTSIEAFIEAESNVTDDDTTDDADKEDFGHGMMMQTSEGLTAKFYLESSSDLEAYEAEVRSKGLSDLYQITTNEDEVTATLEPIKNLSSFSVSFLIIILIVGAVVIGIINMINIRERKYEIGVLRAIGMNKLKVTMQIVAEIFMVSLGSLIIGITIGVLLSQPVTNSMLANEIESMNSEQSSQTENFGSGNFERPSMNGGRGGMNDIGDINYGSLDYVDTLNVSLDIKTIFELLLVCITLTTVSGVISVLFINKYEPNKILQNRA
ncbi:MAG: ABC transporter permease [Bacilli bacterium]|nr:ABC transporter permease [Bacilli bacterium]